MVRKAEAHLIFKKSAFMRQKIRSPDSYIHLINVFLLSQYISYQINSLQAQYKWPNVSKKMETWKNIPETISQMEYLNKGQSGKQQLKMSIDIFSK